MFVSLVFFLIWYFTYDMAPFIFHVIDCDQIVVAQNGGKSRFDLVSCFVFLSYSFPAVMHRAVYLVNILLNLCSLCPVKSFLLMELFLASLFLHTCKALCRQMLAGSVPQKLAVSGSKKIPW